MFIHFITIAGAGQHSFDTWQWIVPRVSLRYTHDVPTQFRFNLGPVSQPIASLMPTNNLRRWPSTTPRLGLLYTQRQHGKQTRAIHPIHLGRWPSIETALGDCPVFAWTAMRVTHCPSRPQWYHYPDYTIYWPNADVILCHRLWRWANIISTLSLLALITNIIVSHTTRPFPANLDTNIIAINLMGSWPSAGPIQQFTLSS